MSTASKPASDPQRLLADTRELDRRVRRAQRGTWSALLVLARVERSRAIVAFSIVYLVAVVASAPTGFHAGRFFLAGVLGPGLVLLAGSALFAVLERPTTPDAP